MTKISKKANDINFSSIERDFIFAYPGDIELDLLAQKINDSFLATSFLQIDAVAQRGISNSVNVQR